MTTLWAIYGPASLSLERIEAENVTDGFYTVAGVRKPRHSQWRRTFLSREEAARYLVQREEEALERAVAMAESARQRLALARQMQDG